MASSNTTTLAGLAKESYPVDEIADMEQRMTTFMKEVPEGEGLEFSATDGGSFNFPVKAYGAHGQKMLNEQEALPDARASNVVQGKAYVKEYAGVLQFTKRELELAKKNPTSFAEAKMFEMESLIENAYKYFNRQMANGDGSGLMTLVEGAQTADTTIEVDDATVFQIGQVLDIFNAAGTTKQADAVVVTDIDILSAQHTIDVDTAVTCDDDGQIYLAGVNDNAATDGKEMIGLPLVVDDGTLSATFQNITRTGAGEVPYYRGLTLDASGAPVSTQLIAQLVSRSLRLAGTKFEDSADTCFLLSPEQWRAYAALAIPQHRFNPGDGVDLNKPYTEHVIMGKRAILDTDVDRRSIYIWKKNTAVKKAVATPLDWEEDLGGTSLKWLSGYAQGIMVLYSLCQMYSQAPRDIAAIQNLETVDI